MTHNQQQAPLDFLDVNLWKGVAPEDMWAKYVAEIDRQFAVTFPAERRHAVLNVRDPAAPYLAMSGETAG